MDFVELLKSTSMRSSGEIIARLIIDESTIKTAKASGNMVVQIVNKGTMDIKFAKVILEKGDGYVILSNPRVYVGEVESDDIETIDFDLYVSEDNPVLSFRIEFLDANNVKFSREVLRTLVTFDDGDAKRYGFKSNRSSSILIIIFIIAAGLIIYKVLRKKRKKE